MINWNDISREEQLDEIFNNSFRLPQLIFKHSSRCSISSMALNRIERQWDINENQVSPFFLDLITYRKLSDSIAEKFHVTHESPQILLISQGKCVYDTSHNDITIENFKSHLDLV